MELEAWDPLDHPARIEVRRQESDDSDAEGGLGNVTRVVLRPPGHSGKAKRGHLCFDASYEGGNLGRVDFISEYEYDLFIRPDTCNPRYRLWFNFVVDNVRADQRVIFNLVNLCKVKTLFRDGMTPLVKTSSRPKWQRVPGKYVYYHKSPEHRNHYILSFAFSFDREEDVYQFAFSFPYSYSRAQAHLALLQEREAPFFRRDTIALSLQNRKVDVITISNINVGAAVGGKRPKTVLILARTHPGESPTSYVAQGLMDFLVSSHGLATALRDHVVIKIVPMINPDGVFLGNLRCSLMGYDLNRNWNQPSPWSQPTLYAMKNYLIDLDSSKGLDLDMVIDIHAHESLMGTFIYGNAYDDVYRFERHILFPKLLAHNAEDYNPSHTMYNRDPNKGGTARRHLCEILKNTVNVYTLEVSYFGYNQPISNSVITYNEDGYLRLGRNVARTLFEYYKVTGVIGTTILSSLSTGPKAGEEKEKGISRSNKTRPSRPKKGSGKSGRSPSAPKRAPREGKSGGSSLAESNGGEKAVVQLSELTKDQSSSSESFSSDEAQATVRITRRETLLHHQLLRRPSDTSTAPKPLTHKATLPNHEPASPPSSPNKNRNRETKKTAYQTFDFSILKEAQGRHFPQEPSNSTKHYLTRRIRNRRALGTEGARKIGGGGVVSRRKARAKDEGRYLVGGEGGGSETEPEAPCLTIIDFNMLIRKGLLEGRGRDRERGWRAGSSSRRGREGASGAGAVNLAGEKGRGRWNRVRRRRAVLLRGTVTDCSAWDNDSSDDSDASNRSAPVPSTLTSRRLEFRQESRLKPALCGGNGQVGAGRRRKSPATPTLSPSPIFLPQ